MLSPRNVLFAAALAGGLILDQATKAWVVANVEYLRDEIEVVPGFLSIVHAQNHGAAFSTMEGQFWVFMAFTVVAVVVIVDLFRRLPADAQYMAASLGLILSGAIGNGIDRVRQRYVTDFIKVFTDYAPVSDWLVERFGTSTWPIFNVADSSLLVGVVAFGLYYLFVEEKEVDEAEVAVADEA